MSDYKRRENESYDDYGMRLFKNKELYGLDKYEIADILNEEFNTKFGESAHRKKFADYIKGFDKGYEKATNDIESKQFNIRGLSSLAPKSHLDKLKENK